METYFAPNEFLVFFIGAVIGAVIGGLLTAWYLQVWRPKSRYRWHENDYRHQIVRESRVRPSWMDSTSYRADRHTWWSFFRFSRKSRNDWDTSRYRGTSYRLEEDRHPIFRGERRGFDFSHKPSFRDWLVSLFRKNGR